MSRKETQQRLGREKVFQTTQRLMAALERMHSGKVVTPLCPIRIDQGKPRH
jgi:hypothetical protein